MSFSSEAVVNNTSKGLPVLSSPEITSSDALQTLTTSTEISPKATTSKVIPSNAPQIIITPPAENKPSELLLSMLKPSNITKLLGAKGSEMKIFFTVWKELSIGDEIPDLIIGSGFIGTLIATDLHFIEQYMKDPSSRYMEKLNKTTIIPSRLKIVLLITPKNYYDYKERERDYEAQLLELTTTRDWIAKILKYNSEWTNQTTALDEWFEQGDLELRVCFQNQQNLGGWDDPKAKRLRFENADRYINKIHSWHHTITTINITKNDKIIEDKWTLEPGSEGLPDLNGTTVYLGELDKCEWNDTLDPEGYKMTNDDDAIRNIGIYKD